MFIAKCYDCDEVSEWAHTEREWSCPCCRGNNPKSESCECNQDEEDKGELTCVECKGYGWL